MPKPEAFSRVLIDQELRESGWDLLDDRRVRFELDGHSGRADYVLCGNRGPLSVLEAKEQARGYAENLGAPLIILSNGKVKESSDLTTAAARSHPFSTHPPP